MQSGFLLIDKPIDWTSHDVIGYIRGFLKQNKLTDIKRPKVGHAGTLDPFATGLLVVGIGREATKRIDEFKNMKKEYIATIRLGATSDTMDRTGKISQQTTVDRLSRLWQGSRPKAGQTSEEDVREVLKTFVGKQQQVPPMYSAKKVGGKKLYELARKGIEIERQPNTIEVYDIEFLNVISSEQRESRDLDGVEIKIACSTGTYIRTLAHDIGQKLGTGAYCEELRRTRIGEYRLEDAIGPEELSETHLQKKLFI